MTDKVEGTTQVCKACGQLTVCRKITYDGHEKLQWQDEKEEKAHYSFDFKTSKVACKHVPQKEDETTSLKQDLPLSVVASQEPTYEQFMEVAKLLISSSDVKDFDSHSEMMIKATKLKIATTAIEWAVINKAMDAIGIKHPSRMAFIRAVQE